ncbi:conserved exported hypothetical protein [Verrucomicrobia bacterium]|nr:conserved exported hypothetical protein [Verrucomicrobiota bacterium]
MRINTTILAIGLGLGSAGLAGAQTHYVYLTGSTAARNAVYATLNSTAVFDAAPTATTQGNSAPQKANYMTFVGNIGGKPFSVKCDWSGSEGGIADIAGNLSENFLTDAAVTSLSSSSPGPFESDVVDLAMADAAVQFSKNPKGAITGTEVCVIPFTFMKGVGSAADLVNITSAQFRQAITGGASLALFTGNAADTSFVYITGRDDNSGTRVNVMGETGYGIFTPVAQIETDSSGNMMFGPTFTTEEGYPSGGGVATQLGVNTSSAPDSINGGTGYSVIGYLGISDALTAAGLGATYLSFNGVMESPTTVEQGQFTYWGNEYCYHKNTASTDALTVYGKLVANPGGITSKSDGTTTIDLGLMNCSRNGPTSDPIHF